MNTSVNRQPPTMTPAARFGIIAGKTRKVEPTFAPDRQYGQTTVRFRTLENYDAVLAYAEGSDRSAASTRGDWQGTNNIDEYRLMLRDGWQAGVDGMDDLADMSTDAAPRLSFINDVAGAFAIVPAYLAGRPDCMMRPVQIPSDAARGVTLVINSSFAGAVSCECALDYARQVMRLVNWLNAKSVDVQVYSVVPMYMGYRRNHRMLYVTNIRQSGEVMRPERIAAILHPSFLRRGYFAMVEYEYHKLHFAEAVTCTTTYGRIYEANGKDMRDCLPDAMSVVMLPQVGHVDPFAAVKEAITIKLKGTTP